MDDIESAGTSFALVHHGGAGEDALLGDTLVMLAEQIAEVLHCSECCVYEYISSRDLLRAQALWSRVPNENDIAWIGEAHCVSDSPGFRRVIERREVVCSYPDDAVDEATSGFESMAFWGERAAIWAPIVHGDEVLGMLELTEKEHERVFTGDEERLVRQMAALAAIALYNARATRAAEERNRQLSALIGASRAMTSTLDLDELLEVICRQAALALDTGSSYIYEYDAEADAMVWLAEYQRDASHAFEEPLGAVYPIEDLPQDLAVVRTRKPVEVRLDDPGLDDIMRRQLLEWGEMSSLMVPLVVGGEVVGSLEVSEVVYPRRFTEQEIGLCVRARRAGRRGHPPRAAVPPHAGAEGDHRAAGHRGRPHRPLQPPLLLGAPARRGRTGQALRPSALAAHARPGRLQGRQRPLGPPGGRRTAARGGPGPADAAPAGRGLRRALRRRGVRRDPAVHGVGARERRPERRSDHRGADPPRRRHGTRAVVVSGWHGVTVSIGVATLPVHATDAEDLVSKADQALYRAKSGGKDTVVVFGA